MCIDLQTHTNSTCDLDISTSMLTYAMEYMFTVQSTVGKESWSKIIIIIIIKYIYRAYFRRMIDKFGKNNYTLNNNVFSLFLNVVRVISVSRISVHQ